MTTIQDVARRAGVSIATVSRVINRIDHKVKKKTRERVLKAISDLDYRPNALARGLLMKKSMTVGLIIPDISNPYYAEIVRGIQDVADQKGYDIILLNTDRRPERIVKAIHLLREKIADGVIFSGGVISGFGPLSALKELRERVVVIGRHDVNFPAAMVDNIGGATQAIQHLIDLGHRRIAYIGGPEDSYAMIDRLKGCQTAHAQNGIEMDRSLIRWGQLTVESGMTDTESLLETKDPPTAIFAGNDWKAFGAIHAARKRGLKVPEDLAVVGFDNIQLADFFDPSLTSVEIPRYELGARTMEMLVDLIDQKDFDRVRWFKTHLVVRNSSLKKN